MELVAVVRGMLTAQQEADRALDNQRGVCAGMKPAEIDRIFFDRAGLTGRRPGRRRIGAPEVDHWSEAREVCIECPVMLACRNWARETREEFGVWGGESPDERRAWMRAQAGTDAP